MSDRMPEYMSERMPDRMSKYMPNKIPDRRSECQVPCQNVCQKKAN